MLVFDLDDTLYSERGFVNSGFAAADARMLELGYPVKPYAKTFLTVLDQYGSGRVFNQALELLDVTTTPELIRDLVHTYRHHTPTIQPREGVPELLDRLLDRGVRLGVITDGSPTIQPGKLRALGIEDRFEYVLCTDELGPDRVAWKPSPLPFATLEEKVGLSSSELTYIGDNPHKDFSGALARGWSVLRLRLPDQLHHAATSPAGVREVSAVTKLEGAIAE